MGVTAEAFARALRRLLPPGALWSAESGTVLHDVLLAIGDELVRVDVRGDVLIDESDPRTAEETLADWERVLGLPDEDVTAIPSTVEERRLAIIQKLIRTGGQSRAYFINLAQACGWGIFIADDFGVTVARAGRARAGDRLFGLAWAFYWRVDVDHEDPVALPSGDMERVIRRVAPAHTVVVFNYL